MDTDILELSSVIERFIYKRAIKKSNCYMDLGEAVSLALEQVASVVDKEQDAAWLNNKANKVRELFDNY
jgi:hypothetical protein